MIDTDSIFNEVDGHLCLWCGADAVGTDLAAMAERCVASTMPQMSVVPAAVATVWPWLEKTDIEIMARFYVDKITHATRADVIENIARRINTAFRSGASGAQVFMALRDLHDFCSEISMVRDDLFFNRRMAIGLDIGEIDVDNWVGVFNDLTRVRADDVLLALTVDTGNKSDFVGRVVSMLNAHAECEFNGGLNFMLGANHIRVEQVWRLVQMMRPEIISRVKFFVGN